MVLCAFDLSVCEFVSIYVCYCECVGISESVKTCVSVIVRVWVLDEKG